MKFAVCVTCGVQFGAEAPERCPICEDERQYVRYETFDTLNAGRRLRSWIRFSHTGEAGGIPGETIALIASLGGAVLVYTGISLAIRRLLSAIARRESASRRAASVAQV